MVGTSSNKSKVNQSFILSLVMDVETESAESSALTRHSHISRINSEIRSCFFTEQPVSAILQIFVASEQDDLDQVKAAIKKSLQKPVTMIASKATGPQTFDTYVSFYASNDDSKDSKTLTFLTRDRHVPELKFKFVKACINRCLKQFPHAIIDFVVSQPLYVPDGM